MASPYEIAITHSRPVDRIMVQIQSTWFPVIDRNPQHYVPSIYEAVQSDFRAATQSIYRSARFPSHLTLPVNTQPAEPLTFEPAQ